MSGTGRDSSPRCRGRGNGEIGQRPSCGSEETEKRFSDVREDTEKVNMTEDLNTIEDLNMIEDLVMTEM